MKNLILMTFVSIISLSSWAKLVVVSDIDDTLKIAHVGKKIDAVLRIKASCSKFLGMPELLHEILKDNEDASIFYLTNAPKFLMKISHTKLIKNGGFPEAHIYFRKGFEKDHKTKTLRHIVNTQQPDTMILIGDNAQEDIKYYDNLVKEFPGIKIIQLIRKVYNKSSTLPLEIGQVGFVSPVDIAIALNSEGLLSKKVANLFIKDQVPKLVAYNNTKKFAPKYLPSWGKCPNFKIPTYSTDLSESADYLTLYEDKIADYCSAR